MMFDIWIVCVCSTMLKVQHFDNFVYEHTHTNTFVLAISGAFVRLRNTIIVRHQQWRGTARTKTVRLVLTTVVAP